MKKKLPHVITPIPAPAPRAAGLSGPLEDYISLRQSLGYKSRNQSELIPLFIRFLEKHGVVSYGQVDSPMVNLWVMTRRAQVAPSSFNLEISMLRLFFDYLVDVKTARFNPFDAVLPARTPKYIPFVFTLEQLLLLFDLIRRSDTSNGAAVGQAYFTIFHTIYALGLRGGELCNLTLDDVDLSADTVFIRRTKFFKDRLLPINPRSHELLARYLRIRKKHPAASKQHAQFFFLTADGKKFSRDSLSHTFRGYVQQSGISSGRRSHPGVTFGEPRLHSLRHTFAVHRLLKWYRDGVPYINSKLPLLATYMGHVDFRYTQTYLFITEEIFRLAAQRFEKNPETRRPDPPGRR